MPEQREQRSRSAHGTGKRSGTSARSSPARGPAEAARRAGRRIERLTGQQVEGVSGVQRQEDGWRISVDVLEVPRIPDTTSLLATYEVELDADGKLLQYRRVRRYRRGAADD
jgi:hypothetical protein